MKYTTDEAHREIISRAHKLDPEAFVSYSGKPRKEKQYVDSLRVKAIRQASDEFYREGHEIVSEEEFKPCC